MRHGGLKYQHIKICYANNASLVAHPVSCFSMGYPDAFIFLLGLSIVMNAAVRYYSQVQLLYLQQLHFYFPLDTNSICLSSFFSKSVLVVNILSHSANMQQFVLLAFIQQSGSKSALFTPRLWCQEHSRRRMQGENGQHTDVHMCRTRRCCDWASNRSLRVFVLPRQEVWDPKRARVTWEPRSLLGLLRNNAAQCLGSGGRCCGVAEISSRATCKLVHSSI